MQLHMDDIIGLFGDDVMILLYWDTDHHLALMSKFVIILHGMSYDSPMFIRIKLLYLDAL